MSEEKKILIVEDDPNIGDVIEIHVNDLGYGLELAPNYIRAEERLVIFGGRAGASVLLK